MLIIQAAHPNVDHSQASGYLWVAHRGKASPESDLDIFVEIPQVTPELRQEIYNTAWEVGYEYGIVISTFLVSTAALVNSPLAANPILQAIDREGVVV